MIQEHQRNLTDLRTVGEALLALGSGLLPASIESARSEGWTPAEVLRALNLGLKMQMTVVQHERLLHGLPTSYHASKAESDARVHIEGVDSILDALSGREGVLNLAQALKDSGLNIDDSIIDAEFSDEGGPRNGTPTTA
jgi:hypothetical protein